MHVKVEQKWPRIPSPSWHIDFEEDPEKWVRAMSPSPLTRERADLYQAINHRKAETQHGRRLAAGAAACESPHRHQVVEERAALAARRVVFLLRTKRLYGWKCLLWIFWVVRPSNQTPSSHVHAHKQVSFQQDAILSFFSLLQPHVHLVCVVARHWDRSTFAHEWGIKTSQVKLSESIILPYGLR